MAANRSHPQYRQVADTLRRRIDNGVYREGDVIPSLIELERMFDVSGITVRKAVEILSAEGRVSGRRGVGTLVTGAAAAERVAIEVSGDFREWLESANAGDSGVEQEVIEIALRAGPPRVAEKLDVDADHALWCMHRLRRIKGVPISYHVNYGLAEVLDGIDGETMAELGSFVVAMRERAGIDLGRMDQVVEAVSADRDLAGLLGTEFGDPLFFIENLYSDKADRPVAVTHLYLRGDRYLYQASIELDEDGAA